VLAPSSTRPEPSWLAGPIGAIGPNIGLAGVIASFSVMCVCYGVVVVRGEQLPPQAVLGAIVLALVLVGIGPPLMSTDVFSYGAYGQMGTAYHLNPYLAAPRAAPLDPWYKLVDWRWSRTPTVYGPAFTALSYVIAGLGVGAALLVYRWIAVIAALCVVAATYRAAPALRREATPAVALVGLNPVLLIYGVGGDHNDLLMLALLVGSILLLTARRPAGGGWLACAAIAVKVTGAVLLPFALAAHGRTARRGVMVGVLGASVALLTVSVAVFGLAPLHLIGTLAQVQSSDSRQSIPGVIALGLGVGHLPRVVLTALEAGCVAAVLGLLVAVRAERLHWLTAAGWAVVALLVTCTFLQPWYVGWLLPFAALSPGRSLRWSALALTAIGLTSL
jgi:alpha-1,6-mannosyltransferase